MAVGDQNDVLSNLKKLLPNGWFQPGETPLLDGLLNGIASALSFVYGMLIYLHLQMRISTATDGFLDLIAADFFGNRLFRSTNQSNDSFRARIIAGILRERNTRFAVTSIITQLTGKPPVIFEPRRPSDTGVYGGPRLFYGKAGGYGSLSRPYESFVKVFRPPGQGVPRIAGYGIPTGAYNTPSRSEWTNKSMTQGITDADLYAAIESVRAAGYTIWVAIV